jgi:hypothetical protein
MGRRQCGVWRCRYSDIDLNFLVDDTVSVDLLYAAAEGALETVSPVTATHFVPPGRYYKLEAGGEFLLIDLCFYSIEAADHALEVERHGIACPLFDKAAWVRPKPLHEDIQTMKRDHRFRELQTWFVISQSFVRKAVLRGQSVEAQASFSSYTLKPLAELLRMRHCPARWDFGMRYLDRDLPPALYDNFKDLVFVRDLNDLEGKLDKAPSLGCRATGGTRSRSGRSGAPPTEPGSRLGRARHDELLVGCGGGSAPAPRGTPGRLAILGQTYRRRDGCHRRSPHRICVCRIFRWA